MTAFCLSLSEPLQSAALEVLQQLNIPVSDEGIPVVAESWDNGLQVALEDGKIVIRYQETCQLFRGLSLALRVLRQGKPIHERPTFTRLGFFEDLSRGAVLTVDSLKKKIRWLAAMGYNALILYIEDIYEVPEYPLIQ